MKISGVYKITNTVTGDFYIGSSKDAKHRLASHKCPSVWKNHPNNPMYQDMKKYGLDKFVFEILEEAEEEKLKEKEQQFIEALKPTYNQMNAKGLNIERRKKSKKEANKKYNKSNKGKESKRKYYNQLCCFNGQTLTLNALSMRFWKQGIDHPQLEAKKYLLNK